MPRQDFIKVLVCVINNYVQAVVLDSEYNRAIWATEFIDRSECKIMTVDDVKEYLEKEGHVHYENSTLALDELGSEGGGYITMTKKNRKMLFKLIDLLRHDS